LNTRVKLLRKQLNLSQKAFAARLGITGAGISKIESGQRALTEQMIIMICKGFNIKEAWLRQGVGDIFSQELSDGRDLLAESYQLDDLDLRIITEYVKLDEKKRKVIKEYILAVASKNVNHDILLDAHRSEEALRGLEEA